MIYSGYENGHYFVRFTHDIKILDAVDVLSSGYKIFGKYLLLLKRRVIMRTANGEVILLS